MPFSLEGRLEQTPQLWAPIQGRRQQGWELGWSQEIPFRMADPNRPGGLGCGASLPDSLAPGVLCPTSVLQGEEQRPREGWASVKATQQDDGRAEHGTRVFRARLLTRFAGMPGSPAPSGQCAFLPVCSLPLPPPTPSSGLSFPLLLGSVPSHQLSNHPFGLVSTVPDPQ